MVKPSLARLCLICLLVLLLSAAAFITRTISVATTSYRDGNYPVAAAAWQQLSGFFPGSAGIAFNNGVTLYRQRKYRQAAEVFSRIRAGTGIPSKAAVQYNLGNCLFRQGEDLLAGDKAGAAEFYRQAVAQYEQAVILDGTDSDARFNLAAARSRLQTVRAALQQQPGQKPGPGARQQEESRKESSQAQGKPAQGNRDASEAKRASTGDQAHDRSSAKAAQDGQKGRSAAKPPRMSRKDAESLMREHLRTEGATAFFRDANKPGHTAEVLKDW